MQEPVFVLRARFTIGCVGSELGVQRILPTRARSARPSFIGILARRARRAGARTGGVPFYRMFACGAIKTTSALEAKLPRWAL